MRFFTDLRLALRPLPFGSYFVPVALLGFYPSKLFLLEEPVTSRCHSPPDVSSPDTNCFSENIAPMPLWCPASNLLFAEGVPHDGPERTAAA
jgi:hypothetical protein